MLLSLLLAMLVSIAGGIEVRVKSYHLSQSKLVCDARNCMAKKFDLSHTVYFIVQNDVPDAVDAVNKAWRVALYRPYLILCRVRARQRNFLSVKKFLARGVP
jgi:hypothetical protein